MNALTLLKGLVSLVTSIAQYMHDKRLIEAGVSKATLEGLQDVQNKMAIASDAIANVDSLSIGEDTANRANKR